MCLSREIAGRSINIVLYQECLGMSERDLEEELLLQKKLLELKKMLAKRGEKKSAREIVLERLVDRGEEVLRAAEEQFPDQTKVIIEKLAEMIKKGYITSNITGAELLWLFRQLGLPVRIETKIRIEKKGKVISLDEKLKEDYFNGT